MVPTITLGGSSFKGAAAYYLHDKRQPGESACFTSERIGWTQNLNLSTDDPERGWKIMAHTALMQDELKAAVGGKTTGRKLTKPVFAYSLSWHPGERVTKEEQLEAVRQSLKVLGLEENQVIVISHNDEPHEHVHVLVNRVNPETGKAAALSNSKLALSKWAQQYEQERGQVLCPQRVKNNARRKQGEFVTSPRVPRPVYEFKKAVASDDLGAEFNKAEQKQQDAKLYATGRVMQADHTREWATLKRTYGMMKDRIKASIGDMKDKKAVEIKAQAKGRWRDLFARQREQRKIFDVAERGTLSKLWSMSLVYRELRKQNRQADALTIFYTLMSSGQRRAVFDEAQENERRDLARKIKQEIGAASRSIDRDAGHQYDSLRVGYLKKCGDLRQRQQTEKAAHQTAWRTRNAERVQALGPIKERAASYRQARHFRRGRSIKDDDLFRRRPPKPDPGQGGPS
jgi:hypothetical protein